ncbi:MAG: 23S rRNA (adenine(2503)-C(2))-methyltransferase [Bacteroidetes bacterium RIFCSPLOWO2_12_FULL_31_6]|nr:MAG: 23S rRNA (adenine(2503)-C(2))-methyltransferase [Bacteroidetes bacterium RIFCSPLOWO2_12_FULL_31_6]
MKQTKKDIRLISKEDLQKFLVSQNEKPFRAKQIEEWIWQKSITSFEQMTNLSSALRKLLEENFSFYPVQTKVFQTSKDRTIKFALSLHDHHIIEAVLIPTKTRMTVCVSSQVGCSLSCSFCATGRMERKRNLDYPEIYDQVVIVNKMAIEKYGIPLSNIVFMGMGEPLLNYNNVNSAIEKITCPEGLNMSPKRITVSTAGIAKMIKKLGDDGVKFNLALSLHAPNDEKRNKIMAINEQNTLEVLADALKYFYQKTENEITFEYCVFKNFNDSLQDAAELVQFCKHVPCKVNLIEYNPIDGGEFVNADEDRLEDFKNFLEKREIITNIRRSRGKDIDAACGQLANKNHEQLSSSNISPSDKV